MQRHLLALKSRRRPGTSKGNRHDVALSRPSWRGGEEAGAGVLMTPGNEQLCRLWRERSGRGTHQFALNRLNLVTHLAGALNSMAGPTPGQAEKIAAADDACVMAYKALSDSKRPSYGVEDTP